MKFQQIRGATAIVSYGGKRFLIDPFLSDQGTLPPIPSPYNQLPNPLVDLPRSKEDIVNVDAVIVTHMHHFDHFDEAAQKAIRKDMPMFAQSAKEARDMLGLGFVNVTALLDDGVTFENVTLYRTDAEHGHGEAAHKNYEAFGLPPDASGVIFKAPGEKTFYMAGDTLWNDMVKAAIEKFQPEVIALNAAHAQFADGTPILMGTEGLYEVTKAAPQAVIIATHLDAVNHARVSRNDMRRFVEEKKLTERVSIPEDGEVLSF